MLNVISHLLKMSGTLERAESLTGRAGRSNLQDLRSSRISTLTRVVQVVVPSDGVVSWFGPLESLLDIVVVGFMIVLGRGPLCQVPFGRPEEANKVGRQVNVVLLFFSKLSIGPDNDVFCLIRLLVSNHFIQVILLVKWILSSVTGNQLLPVLFLERRPHPGLLGRWWWSLPPWSHIGVFFLCFDWWRLRWRHG